jgi:hypothetical protein
MHMPIVGTHWTGGDAAVTGCARAAPASATPAQRDPARLRREIAALMVVKLVVLAGLWLAFFRGHDVRVDPRRAAGLLGIAADADGAGAPSGGDSHGQ